MLGVSKGVDPLFHISEDAVWMAPLALVGITVVLTGLASVPARLGLGGPWRALPAFVGAGLVTLNLLLLVPRLAPAAAAVLAAGVALQIARQVTTNPERAHGVARRTGPWLAVISVTVVAGLWIWLRPTPAAAAAAPDVADRPLNVVVITLDTVRAASMSLYGYNRPTTPVLERIAQAGTVFDAAFTTAPWTLPSHASMFTGRWPHELSVDYDVPLDGMFPTLADAFTARGYATAGFAANLGYVSDESGLGRGFQHYEDYPRSLGQIASSSTLVRTIADNFRVRRLIANDQHLNRVHARDLNRRASRWLDAHADRPFLLFLNYFDAHEPYLPPAPFDRQFGPGRARGQHSPLHHWLWNPAVGHSNMDDAARQEEQAAYDGALAALDQDLGALVADLDRRGLTSRTVLVITADHGEEFGEHGVYDHGYSLYGVSVHVPLVIVAPAAAPAGRRVSTPVTLRDLPATVCELAGCGPTVFPGTSLSAHWRDNLTAPPSTSPVFFEVRPSPGQPDWFPSSKGPMVGVVIGQWHYIRNGDGREELYDRVADPFEQHDRSTQPDARDTLITARARVANVVRARSGPPCQRAWCTRTSTSTGSS